MADKRKLQSEIDRCIKRIQEGVEEFDEIWAKVQEATNNNQKEKYETDLKKEIKKLQRLREQIKGWLNSNEIKDKSVLQEYRRVIEQKMEQFKVVERETKTKAYSKQGLGAEQKLDPKEKEKEETIYWLQECIDRLSQQNDKFESEIEQLSAGGGKKKKLDKDKQERLDELRRHLERHKFHIQKLELLMRLLTNNSLESYQVVKIREDLEYYITSNQDDEFEENDFIYDDLNLGDVEQLAQQLGNMPSIGLDESENNSETNTTTSVSPSASPAPSQNSKDSNKDSDDIKLRHVSGEEVVKPLVSRNVPSSLSRSTPTTPLKLTSQLSIDSALSTPPSTGTPPLVPTTGMPYNSVAAGTKTSATKSATVASRATSSLSFESKQAPPKLDSLSPLSHVLQQQQQQTPFGGGVGGGITSTPSGMALPLVHSLNLDNAATPSASATPTAASAAAAPSTGINSMTTAANSSVIGGAHSTPPLASLAAMAPPLPASPLLNSNAATTAPQAQTAQQMVSDFFSSSAAAVGTCRSPIIMNGPVEESKLDDASVMSLKLLAEKVASTSTPLPSTSSSISNANVNSPMTSSSLLLTNNMLPGSVGASLLMGLNALNSTNAAQQQQQQQQHQTQEAKIPPLLGASPLGKIPLSQEHLFQLSTLENAMHHMPMPADSERLRTYLPRSTCQVPPHYPQSPPPMADALEYFTNLQPETLFFIFYYLEGTKAQYLAAKALKRQSWRFHTKYMMWFQRHEEPKTITEEFEQGTYIYFDFEKWAQRKKEGFTFEYRYLEDKELS